MTPAETLSPADQLVAILAALHRSVGARMEQAGPLAALLTLVWNRLGRLCDSIARVIERLNTAPSPRRRSPTIPPAGEISRAARKPGVRRMPTKYCWLVDLLGRDAAAHGAQLLPLLESAELRLILRSSPQLRRLLRPLCRGLGVPLTRELREERPVPLGPILPAVRPGEPPPPYVAPPPPRPVPKAREHYQDPRYYDVTDPRYVQYIIDVSRRRRETPLWRRYFPQI